MSFESDICKERYKAYCSVKAYFYFSNTEKWKITDETGTFKTDEIKWKILVILLMHSKNINLMGKFFNIMMV